MGRQGQCHYEEAVARPESSVGAMKWPLTYAERFARKLLQLKKSAIFQSDKLFKQAGNLVKHPNDHTRYYFNGNTMSPARQKNLISRAKAATSSNA
jgi:hypothetical protein